MKTGIKEGRNIKEERNNGMPGGIKEGMTMAVMTVVVGGWVITMAVAGDESGGG